MNPAKAIYIPPTTLSRSNCPRLSSRHSLKQPSQLQRHPLAGVGNLPLSETRMHLEQEDILQVVFSDEPEGSSVELSPGVTAELNAEGELIGVEILNASAFIRDTILETVQAKMLSQAGAQAA